MLPSRCGEVMFQNGARSTSQHNGRGLRALKACVAALLVLFVATSFAAEAEVAKTWRSGAFILPAELSLQLGLPEEVSRIDKHEQALFGSSDARRYHIAVLMHGCAGLSTENIEAAKHLARLGFAVFLPSYYGRSNAQTLCAGSASGVPFFINISWFNVAQRLEEFDYAVQMIMRFKFWNGQGVLAMGHSMGGLAVANLRHPQVKAGIITGWGCSSPFSRQLPSKTPQLNVRFVQDPWLPDSSLCEVKIFSGRESSNTRVVALTGQTTHEVMHDARTREAISQFVTQHFLRESVP
jgi:hypothetical protein